MNLVDTHCHLDLPVFDEDRADVLENCQQLGVSHIVVPGVMAKTWGKLTEICNLSPLLHACYGLHPFYLAQHTDDDIDALKQQIDRCRPIALGEIGLDYFVDGLDHDHQQSLFDAQLAIAANAALPVLLHVRKSHDAVLTSLRKARVKGGICHAFNGSLQQAERYIELGFKLGFGGMLTYERSHKLQRLAKQLPIEAIVLETDAPDMTVASHHGQRNSPEYLPECLQALANAREEDISTLAEQTTQNAEDIFNFGQ